MLYIYKGTKRIKDQLGNIISQGRDAGTIQNDVHTQIGECEHNASVQHKKEGKNILILKKETIAEARTRIQNEHKEKHLPFDPVSVVEEDLKISLESESISPILREVYVSPNCKKEDGSDITIDDFPDGWSFGNGVTANASVRLKNGELVYLTWCSFPEGTVLTSNQKAQLRSICEI